MRLQMLDTFTLFLKLPSELRFMVWHECFPRGREVNFGEEIVLKSIPQSSREGIVSFDDLDPLPITLQINMESRRETERHYCIILRQSNREEPNDELRSERPFCYNPKLYTAWINPLALQTEFSKKWFAYLATEAPEVFAQTKILEIRNWYPDWPSNVILIDHRQAGSEYLLFSTTNFRVLLRKFIATVSPPLKALLSFNGLKCLRLIPCADFDERALRIPNSHQENTIKIVEFFDENKGSFGGKAPLVKIEKRNALE
ncbi:hypothetical protein N431DRAFT_470762 [Stipitochalara longipes BDJ]|nr:hypothetical protein N431DRAFT_470762 [Stipitochalara longipes BDJ]